MNVQLIRRLMLKDWYLHRLLLLCLAVIVPLAGLLIAILGGDTTLGNTGLMLTTNSLIWLIFFLPIGTVLNEKTKQTLPFVMSLPISALDYAASKLLGNLLVFLVAWGIVAGGLVIIVDRSEALAPGLYPLLAVLLLAFLLFFLLTAGAAIVTESAVLTSGVGLMCIPLVFLFFPLLEQLPPRLLEHWIGELVVWDREVVWTLAGELVAILGVVGITFVLQSRKRDFV